MRAAARQPAGRGLRGPRGRRPRGGARVKFGVVRFPGSCDEVDALAGRRARRRGGAALARRRATCRASTRSSCPAASPTATTCASGRSRASRRSMESVDRVRRARAAPCSASATASRSSARPSCCRARCCRTPTLRFTFRQVDVEVVRTRHAVHARVREGERLSIPAKHTTGALLRRRRAARRARGRRPGRPALRARARTSTARSRDIAGVCNEARQRLRPDAPPRARRRRADAARPTGWRSSPSMAAGRGRRVSPPEAAALPGVEDALALGLTRDEYELVVREARPPAEPGRAGDVLAAVERALRLQALQEAAAHAAHRGRRRRAWARARTPARSTSAAAWSCAFKVESHNHPSAVEPFQGAATGVGGILRDIFALGARPDRRARLAALRRAAPSARSRYLLDRAVAGIGHYGNSIGVPTVGGEVYFEAPYEHELPRQRDGARPRAARAPDPLARRPASATCVVLFGASTGPRRHRRRVGAGQRRARRGRRRQAPDRPGRRPLRGEEAPGVLAGAARRAACSSRCRTSARRG